jgi:uncharacterized repeat protein (TIGR03803 family)
MKSVSKSAKCFVSSACLMKGIVKRWCAYALALSAAVGLAVVAAPSAQAQTFTVLHAFSGRPDGDNPAGGLILDSAGNLYGTTWHGEVSGVGTIFKLDTSSDETVLYSFAGKSGTRPFGATLLRDSRGNLYGTTTVGGSSKQGTVFRLGSNGRQVVLHSFSGGVDGGNPYAGLIRDTTGNLYGTTAFGGTYGDGVVFVLDRTGTETVLYSFTGGADGRNPFGGLIRDPAGDLYGTTEIGGDLNCEPPYGCGTVFKIDSTGNETTLHIFTGGSDGANPYGSLVGDAAGNLYGTTSQGGPSDSGTVFKLDTNGVETVLYSFTGALDGGYPKAGLVFDAAGNLYGTTEYFGASSGGTVFKLDTAGTESTLHSFNAGSDGGTPVAGLDWDAAGNLYGTTLSGGASACRCGTVFKLKP